MSYSKNAYDIDLNSLVPELVEIINTQHLNSTFEISKEEYINRIKLFADHLKALRKHKNEPYFIVQAEEPAFDFWMAFFLSSKKPHLIQLILDQYFETNENPEMFLNRVEHSILRIMAKNIFHDIENQLKEISNWVREKRKEYAAPKNVSFEIVNINSDRIDIKELIQNYAPLESDRSSQQNDSNGSSTRGVIEPPYDNLFFQALTEHCETSSIANLQALLNNEKIESTIVLNSNFKKISLIQPIKALVSRGLIKMSQKQVAKWLSDNFAIRRSEGLDYFSFSSNEKRLAQFLEEPKNAQIKYTHWFKK